jgi:cold shock protein
MSFDRRGPRSDRGGGARRGGGRDFDNGPEAGYDEYRPAQQGPRIIGTGEGVVKWFNSSKGFGFIAQDDGPDIYVHRTAVERAGIARLNEGDRLRYNLVEYRGRQQGADLEMLESAGGGDGDGDGDSGHGGGSSHGGGASESYGGDVQRGSVKFFNIEKGFGFIQPESGGEDIFFHISGLLVRDPVPQSGEMVSYRTANHRGRMNAVDVERADG